MATSYTTIWRLPVMTVGDPLVKNAWGAVLNNMMPLIEQGGVGNAPILITGLTTYTLTTANDSADQARLNTYNFTGALTGNCTVTIPAIARVGWVINSTSGGHNVILTTGSGAALTVAPGLTYFWTCDATSVTTVSYAANALTLSGNATVGGTLGVTGNATLGGTLGVTGATSLTSSLAVGGTLRSTGAATFVSSITLPAIVSAIVANSGSIAIDLSAAGMSLHMSSGGSAVFDWVASNSTFGWGVGATTPMSLAGNTGNLTITGALTQASDRRLKRRVKRISANRGLEWLSASKPVEYEMHGRPTAGLIAQDQIAAGFDRGIYLHPNPKMRATKDSPAGQQYVLDLESRVAYLIAALKGAVARIEALEKAAG